jgi:glycine/D-amino acid oxidase-like deaminating enzyme
VTVCDDQEGTDGSTRRAAGWVRDNLGDAVSAPHIAEGDDVFYF